MTLENRFSLIDEPWIPIADSGRVGLRQIFSNPSYRTLGGNPVQKIAVTKLLLAIAQAAATPADDYAWQDLTSTGLAEQCINYLAQHHDKFWLYGSQPFLQIPTIASARTKSVGTVLPEIATGNTTVLSAVQVESPLSDADLALLVVQLMGFALGGKKTDNAVVLSPGYQGKSNDKGKPATARAGASLGFRGYLHSFLQGETLLQSLWLNLLTAEQIQGLPYQNGLGIAPWETMPHGEQCPIAQNLQNSLMGRLIPLSRFCLLTENGLHYSEGIAHLDYKSGLIDPSVAINRSTNPAKVLWVDPERRPWRSLTALLSFLEANGQGFECTYIRQGLLRARKNLARIGIWTGGLSVSSSATGDQFVSGSNDFVESFTFINSADMGDIWYAHLKMEMAALEQLAKIVYSAVSGYYKNQKADGKKTAAAASNLFWQLCERNYAALVRDCKNPERNLALRNSYAQFANTAYDRYCPNTTARQLNAWAANRPKLRHYLKDPHQAETNT